MLLCVGCNTGGDRDDVPAPIVPSPQVEQQAIENLLALYQQALVQEDIDQLDALLQPQSLALSAAQRRPQRQAADDSAPPVETFRNDMAAAFRTLAITALQIPATDVQIAADRRRVTFLEIESAENPATLSQYTRLFRTTFWLSRAETPGVVLFRITAVRRARPLVQIITRGQGQAGAAARLEVESSAEPFAPTAITVEVPETAAVQDLTQLGNHWHGVFTAPQRSTPQPLQLRLRDAAGEALVLRHHYRLRGGDDLAVQRLAGTGTARFFAVTVAPEGTVWAGGDGEARLYHVPPGATTATLTGRLLDNPLGRVEDLTVDAQGRLHALFVDIKGKKEKVVDNGVMVWEPQHPDVLCRTVNVFDSAYPLTDSQGEPSPSARLLAAGGRQIWLLGSDGGVARVADSFRDGICPQDGVSYAEVFRRDNSDLLSNTVPALVASADGALWFGTAFGLTRRAQGQFTPVPFDSILSFRGQVATLEAFFQEVAQAIFAARPLTTVQVGEVSFVEAFGSALIKADLILSAVEDDQGRLWVGTLGGGVRRLEVRDGVPQDTLRVRREDGSVSNILTRQDGLSSNIIFALAVGRDGSIWAATDDGVTRIQEEGGETFRITTVGALDGLALAVRDAAVDDDDVVWLATDGGLFRLAPQAGRIHGVVRDPAGQPVAGADVTLLGTPLRAVTDDHGRFVLTHLPPETYHLHVDGSLATGGRFTSIVQEVVVSAAQPAVTLGTVRLEPVTAPFQLLPISGDAQSGVVGRPLPVPLQLQVVDAQGSPASGVLVTFTILSGSGAFFDTPITTRDDCQGAASRTVATTPAGQATVPLAVCRAGLTLVEARVDGARVTFAAFGLADRDTARLLQVSGNNQSGRPGQVLPKPILIRLEDQFGNPLEGEPVAATFLKGGGVFRETARVTDPQGQASFVLQVGESDTDIVVEVATPALPQVKPVQFLAIVGAIDTPDLPLDVAVAGDFVFVADRFSGLQVFDASNAATPQRRHTLDTLALGGNVLQVARADNRLYVTTVFRHQLVILDITDPAAPTFAADTDGNGVLDVELGRADFPAEVQNHAIAGLAVQGALAYVVTDARTAAEGTLQVFDISDPAMPQWRGAALLPNHPHDIAVLGHIAYVPAEVAGLLIFDISNPQSPTQIGVLTAPDLSDHTEVGIFSGIALAAPFAYMVETHCQPQCSVANARFEERFTVLDLSMPEAPQRRGTVPMRLIAQGFSTALAVAGQFAYVVQFSFGLQAIDVRNPDKPRLVGAVDTPSQALQVATAGDLLYVTDQIFGLQVIQGPGSDTTDSDTDGVSDFFDVFPSDASESEDSDEDGLGNKADSDDDNDGFSDAAERAEDPPTDPRDARSFPLHFPPTDALEIIVDAGAAPRGDGTLGNPYRSLSEALRAIRSSQVPQIKTISVRPGTYSVLTTQEVFPLNLAGLPPLTLRSTDPTDPEIVKATVIDAGFSGDILLLRGNSQMVIDGLTLVHGATGILINTSTEVTIRHNRIMENIFPGIALGISSNKGNVVEANVIHNNGQQGIVLFESAQATITENKITQNGFSAIEVLPDSTAEISRNTLRGNAAGVVLSAATATITDNTIIDNRGQGGVEAFSSGNPLIANLVQGGVAAFFSSATISGNTISSNGGLGITLTDSTANRITKNIISDNIGGIALTNAQATITKNTITENDALGGVVVATISSAPIASATISDNTISGNHGIGITVTGAIAEGTATGANAVVTANTINGNNGGVVLALFSTAAISDNTIVSNGVLGGVAIGFRSLAALTANTISDNAGDGIAVGSFSGAVINGGVSQRNRRHGIFIIDNSEAEIGRDGPPVLLAQNGGFGIFVINDPSSCAFVDRAHIVFDANAAGETAGCVRDIFDEDVDGLRFDEEIALGTDPTKADTDGDGLLDGFEARHTLNPLDNRDGTTDPDGDGLDNQQEQDAGTDPRHSDTDGDGLPDQAEVLVHHTNPLHGDSDGDGLADAAELRLHATNPLHPDSDGDGTGDGAEVDSGTDPLDATSAPVSLATGAVAVGFQPRAVVLSDLDGDGILDLITANNGSHDVSVLLGDGLGGFTSTSTLPVGLHPGAVVADDFDGDTKPDLAVANVGANTVSMLLGDGRGGFTAAPAVTVGLAPSAVVAGDFNSDTKPDLAVANAGANTVSVLLGDGRGGFSPARDVTVGPTPSALALGDVNDDGTPDLVVANANANTVWVLLGDGKGNFRFRTEVLVGFAPNALALGNLTGDSALDLAVVNAGSNNVSVLRGDRVGGFFPALVIPVGFTPLALDVGDVSGDMVQDLIVANFDANRLSVLLGDGVGGFVAVGLAPTGPRPRAVALGDVNSDGKLDLAVANLASNNVSILLGDGSGGFAAANTVLVGRNPSAVVLGDFDANDTLDVAVANGVANAVAVLLGDGHGVLATASSIPVGRTPLGLAVDDLNGDDALDLIVGNSGANTVAILLGNGLGDFTLTSVVPVDGPPRSVVLSDLTGEGDLDIVVANSTANTVSILLGDGHGGFRATDPVPVESFPVAAAVGDLTGEGDLDIVVANYTANTVSILLGDGHGGFRAADPVPVGFFPTAVALEDLNGDRVLDLAVTSNGSNTVSVFLGDGSGGFELLGDFLTGLGPSALAIGDMDGNGTPDLVVASQTSNTVSLFLGNGSGGFVLVGDFLAGLAPNALALGDLNGDGRLDVVVTNSGANNISVLLSRSP